MGKRWTRLVVGLLAGLLLLAAGVTLTLDPYFHYWVSPLYSPIIHDQRYQNPGLARHYPYDALVLGSSMVENTNISQLNALYGIDCIKLPMQGGTAKNLGLLLDIALSSHDVQLILYGLDVYSFYGNPNATSSQLPDYLWNGTGLDDIQYLLNFDTLAREIPAIFKQLLSGQRPSVDWNRVYAWEPTVFSAAQTLSTYPLDKKVSPMREIEPMLQNMRDNLNAHLLPYIQQNPDTQFILYYPPYSSLYWVLTYDDGILDGMLAIRQQMAELLLACPNVQLYDFSAKMEWIEDLNLYTDYSHHSPAINEQIVDLIYSQQHRVETAAQIEQANQNIRSSLYTLKEGKEGQ